MIGERVELARVARGMSQRDLASAIGVSAMAISLIEQGHSIPTMETMRAICEATKLSSSFFTRQSLHLPSPLYRKKSSLGKKAVAQVEKLGTLQAEAVLRAWSAAGVNLPVRTKNLEGATPEAAAVATRRLLGLDDNKPIDHLLAVLEQAGCVVHQLANSDPRFDGFSTVHEDRPVIVLGPNREGAGDRQRMTAVHELAHTVLHRLAGIEHKQAEDQADEFASAFLLPRDAILEDLRRATLNPIGLAPLKAKWRVSISALCMRAAQLGLMTKEDKTRFYKEMSARGWRRVEPVAIPLERPQVFRKTLDILRKRDGDAPLAELCGGVSRDDMLEMAGLASA